MANTKQGEAAHAKSRADTYKAIALVIDQMPTEFLPTKLYKLAGLNNSMWTRKLVAIVLEQDFKCRKIGCCGRQRWSKA